MIYLDNAATTPLCPEAYEAMIPYLTKYYGNAASRSTPGREASRALEKARESIAEMLGTKPKEIYFTSGATESNNWALKGVALRHRDKGKHIVTTQVEHPSVLNSGKWLERMGFDVTYLPVSEKGSVDPSDVYRAISSDTTLVSVMATNNETGISNPIYQIADIAKDKGVYFHVDATQSITHDIISRHGKGNGSCAVLPSGDKRQDSGDGVLSRRSDLLLYPGRYSEQRSGTSGAHRAFHV